MRERLLLGRTRAAPPLPSIDGSRDDSVCGTWMRRAPTPTAGGGAASAASVLLRGVRIGACAPPFPGTDGGRLSAPAAPRGRRTAAASTTLAPPALRRALRAVRGAAPVPAASSAAAARPMRCDAAVGRISRPTVPTPPSAPPSSPCSDARLSSSMGGSSRPLALSPAALHAASSAARTPLTLPYALLGSRLQGLAARRSSAATASARPAPRSRSGVRRGGGRLPLGGDTRPPWSPDAGGTMLAPFLATL
eukprot:365028-Chlamydomonas_euryale.AAC.24